MRTIVLTVAHEPHVQSFLTRGPGRSLARRFVAGETLEEALAAARRLVAAGARVSLDYLGEAVTSFADAQAALAVYRTTIAHLRQTDLPVTLSVKPSQFGLDLSRDRCLDLLSELVGLAASAQIGVRLDMEDSSHTDNTLWLWEQLRARGLEVGVVLQAALYRTAADLERVLAAGGSVRLCKGAYLEPPSIAYPRKADVDRAYARLLDRLLRAAAAAPVARVGYLPLAAIATHDERLIARAIELIHQLKLDPDRYEFQMLYGVRRDLQERLIAQEYPLRVYTPWGPSWYPYLTRRLAERPANLLFVVSSLLREALPRRSASEPSSAEVGSARR